MVHFGLSSTSPWNYFLCLPKDLIGEQLQQRARQDATNGPSDEQPLWSLRLTEVIDNTRPSGAFGFFGLLPYRKESVVGTITESSAAASIYLKELTTPALCKHRSLRSDGCFRDSILSSRFGWLLLRVILPAAQVLVHIPNQKYGYRTWLISITHKSQGC